MKFLRDFLSPPLAVVEVRIEVRSEKSCARWELSSARWERANFFFMSSNSFFYVIAFVFLCNRIWFFCSPPGYTWTLVFSTSQHGFSLSSLYRKMNRIESPILLVIQDTDCNVSTHHCDGPKRDNNALLTYISVRHEKIAPITYTEQKFYRMRQFKKKSHDVVFFQNLIFDFFFLKKSCPVEVPALWLVLKLCWRIVSYRYK